MKKDVAIVGASGYTGIELTKILSRHPHVNLRAVASQTNAGRTLSTIMGVGAPDMKFCSIESKLILKCDVIFSCLPHGAAAKHIVKWRKLGKIVFDLSADFRLKDKEQYKQWYHLDHPAPHMLKDAVYGLPELHREKIKKTSLVACPGCYTTATILGIMPALKAGIISPDIFVSAVSGTSGAGKQAKHEYSYCEVNENLSAYALPNHRHTPEMEQELSLACDHEALVSFVPHLGPFNRGIHATITASLTAATTQEKVTKIYRDFYASAAFVKISEKNPQLKDVVGTNFCLIRPIVDVRTGRLIALSVLDNLIKGASGQAVQCFNIRFKYKENEALDIGPC